MIALLHLEYRNYEILKLEITITINFPNGEFSLGV